MQEFQDSLGQTLTTIVLTLIGGLISIVAYGVKKFMSHATEKIDEHDKRMDQIDVKIAHMESHYESIENSLKSIAKGLEKMDDKFDTYDKNIAEFWKNYGKKLDE